MVLKKLPKQLGGESMLGCVQSVRNAFEMEMFEEVSERERVFEALSAFFRRLSPSISAFLRSKELFVSFFFSFHRSADGVSIA